MANKANVKLRLNLLTFLMYIIGAILLFQLFNLQIVNGEEYKETSNTRLTRETTLEASRGDILARDGTTLVTSSMTFDLEMYKTNIEDSELNEGALNIINVLKEDGVTYTDEFPISIDPFEYTISGDTLVSFKETYDLDEDATAEEAFYYFVDRYNIDNTDITEIRKILAIRYLITTDGMSSTKSITIAEDLSRETVAKFSESSLSFPGINMPVTTQREYTSGTLAAHILGYTGTISSEQYSENKDTYDMNDIVGKTGVEYIFEEFLKGEDGVKQIDMDMDGLITDEYITEEAIAGSDVVLTIDADLQKITEDALEANINKIASGGFSTTHDTNSGAAIVMDVDTGEILAMASYPTYDPSDFIGGISTTKWNEYINDEAKPLLNKAVQTSYAPGSIFKMVTGIAALESGSVTLTEEIYDSGVYDKYTNLSMKCWYYTSYNIGHGYLNISEAIQKSCNYFFYEAADRMGIDVLAKYAAYFGLGEKTGVELQSETAGVLASQETKAELHTDSPTWNPGDTLNAAIGQGDNEFTPIQIAKYISMLANGGENIDVTLIKTIINADGSEYTSEEIREYTNALLGIDDSGEDLDVSQENLNAILEGMKSVTSDTGGTAYSRFQDLDIEVGGKTGSAEAPNDKVHAWFVGFAPYDDPEIAIVVMVDNGGHGNYTAEAVAEIIEEYFGMNTDDVAEDLTAISYTESLN